MKRKLNELKRGDVIIACIPKQGNHTVIILEDYDEQKHVKCLNACSFSSQPSGKDSNRFLSIEGVEIPEFFFKQKKEYSYLRIDEPICLKKFLVRDYLGTMKDHTHLWQLICDRLSQNSALATIELDGICDCQCLKENEVNSFYCIHEIAQLPKEVIEEYSGSCITSCPCCYRIIAYDASTERCPYCDDNNITLIHDFGENYTFHGVVDRNC